MIDLKKMLKKHAQVKKVFVKKSRRKSAPIIGVKSSEVYRVIDKLLRPTYSNQTLLFLKINMK